MQIHGPSVIGPDPTDIDVDVNATHPERPFVKVEFPGGVRFYLDDGDADVLIKVFLQAKDMLHAHRHAVACHAGLGEYVNGTAPERTICPADWGSATESQRCVGRLGHSAGHRDSDGHEWTDETRAHVMSSSPGRDAQGLPVAEDDVNGTTDAPLPEPGPWTLKPQPATAPGEVHMACVDTAIEVPEDAQAAEVKRIGQLHADGLITDKECAGMVDKVLGEHA